ncbi:SDR family NAD(P)-dependent oxidoreductase [Roseomonas marmotae]|nr:SDR family oxidoreductase [Roseomonas marmotae]
MMPTALVTGASGGIGAVYADRLAARGHDLVLVARSADKLEALARDLRARYGIQAEMITADLTDPAQVARVVDRIRSGAPIDILINNAGANVASSFAKVADAELEALIRLNVTAPTLLARAAIAGMASRGTGAIVNIGSVIGLATELTSGIYGATKAYMLTFSQSLAHEFGPAGVYVQAVLPGATRTDIWRHSGRNIDEIDGLMEVDDLVDAALAGFDRREAVTIPPLPDVRQWEAFEAARLAMRPNFANGKPADRYV